MTIHTLLTILAFSVLPPDTDTSLFLEQLLKNLRPDNPRPVFINQKDEIFSIPVKNKKSRACAPAPIDSVIKNDFLCNDDVSGGCAQRAPKIIASADGSFVVCWYEFRDGDADIWFQRFDSSGTPIGINERVNTDVTIGWQGDPAAACGPDGSFILTWEDRRIIGNSDLFAQWFNRDGSRRGDNFRVSDSTAPGDQSISGVAIAPDGVSLVVWDDRRNGITGDIYAQFLNPDGSPRGSNFRVNDDPLISGNQYEPEVAVDDSSRFIVTWMDGRDRNWNIYAQRFTSSGESIGSNFRVTPQDSNQLSPQIACSPEGYSVICWNDRRRNQWDVYAQIYTPDGQGIGENFRVNNDTGAAQQLLGDVAINRLGEFIVVWVDNRNGNDDIFAQRFNIQGIRLGNEFRLNDDEGIASQSAPAVTALPDGGYLIVWADTRNGDYDIYCQRITREGTKIGRNFRVNDDFASSHQRVSSIGLEKGENSLMIAWEDERNSNCHIYAGVFDEQGNQNGQNLRINDDPIGSGSHYYPSVAGGKGRFIVAWYDSRQGSDIYAQFIAADGTKIGSNFLVNEGAISAFQWYPFCAMDTLNRSVIVWMDNRNNTNKIYARRYEPDGNPAGPEFRVSDSPDTVDEYYASVAMSSSGYWVTAWMDYRDGDANIYCQLFKPDGEKIGPNIRVNTDPNMAYQGYPACAIDENRNIAIAWEDTRNNSYDVYLQWLDSLGNLLGDNEQVNENPPGVSDCYSPSCAFDQNGRLVVMFNDEREAHGNPQIYCQRFRSDRTRIGHNQKINEPNLFPKNVHWTVGQSVAAGTEFIAFTWTENRRHRGWDIYAKITDWNLVGLYEPAGSDSPAGALNPPAARILVVRRNQAVLIPQSAKANLLLFDQSGCQRAQILTTANNYRLDTKHLTPGIYFLNLQKQNSRIKYKLVII
jgi:hypothetical protein